MASPQHEEGWGEGKVFLESGIAVEPMGMESEGQAQGEDRKEEPSTALWSKDAAR